MTREWKQFVGDLCVADDGTFLVRDRDSGSTVKAAEIDRSRAEPEEISEGQWTWTVDLPADATLEDVDMDEQAWNALFENQARRGEDPSVHNSWCSECPSVGISHGVCC